MLTLYICSCQDYNAQIGHLFYFVTNASLVLSLSCEYSLSVPNDFILFFIFIVCIFLFFFMFFCCWWGRLDFGDYKTHTLFYNISKFFDFISYQGKNLGNFHQNLRQTKMELLHSIQNLWLQKRCSRNDTVAVCSVVSNSSNVFDLIQHLF